MVGAGCRIVLCQRPLKPDKGIHIIVGHMVDNLPDGPAAGTVRRQLLLQCQPLYGST
ncbi:hypothetical protein D3C76_1838880 [compost metagenome]